MIEVKCSHDAMVNLNDLKPHPKNRNKHPSDQIKRLAQIIQYQGIRSPIKVSNLSGHITAGHGRLEAFRQLKIKQAPVNYQDYESEEQEYADLQSDNAIALWAELDLSGINTDVVDLGPDFDIDLLGIKDFVLEPADKVALTDEDEVPDETETRVKLGDRWILGDHVLVCGDSTKIDIVEVLLGGNKVHMVFTDPPYNIGLDYHGYDDKKPDEAFDEMLKDIFTICYGLIEKKGHCLFTMGHKWMFRTKDLVETCGFDFRHLGIWHNPQRKAGGNPGMWPISYEAVLDFTKDGFKKLNNGNSVGHTDVWLEVPTHETGHPAQKPIALWGYLLELCSDVGNNIYEPFGGSGSTLIACEKTNRKCFMMEIDPHYCDVILTRWEKYTGKEAKLDGQTQA